MTSIDQKYRLRSEKIVNESWSIVEKYLDKILIALEKDELEVGDILLLRMASRAFVQKVMLERADNEALFEIDPYTS